MTEIIKSNSILEATDDKEITHFLKISKCIVIVMEYETPFGNMPYYTIFIFSETNVRYDQYKKDAITDHNLK